MLKSPTRASTRRCIVLLAAVALTGCDQTETKARERVLERRAQSLHSDSGEEVCAWMGYDNIIRGTPNDDVLHGTDGRDCILGFEGTDEVWGKGGEDLILGGDGNDRLAGEAGDDVLVGGRGNDTLLGDSDNDRVLGGPGDDVITGGPGDDALFGEEGADTLDGESGENELNGGDCHDVLIGGSDVEAGQGFDRCEGPGCDAPVVDGMNCKTDADCGADDRCVVPTGICVPRASERCEHETFPEPVEPDFSKLGMEIKNGMPVLLAMPGIEFRYNRDLTDPITAMAACTTLINGCLSPPTRGLDECFAAVPRCTTDKPWEEARSCCPNACAERYQALRAEGHTALDAYQSLLFNKDRCMPGLRAYLEENTP
jgi:hypothetical protein